MEDFFLSDFILTLDTTYSPSSIFLDFIINKFNLGIILIKRYWIIIVTLQLYLLSIKAIADTGEKKYKYLNIIVQIIIKFPINLCVFGFSFLFNYIKNKRFHGYIFSMFTAWKCKAIKESVSYDNDLHITKHLYDALENIGHLHTTQDKIKRHYYREKIQHNLLDLHKDHPNGIKQLFNIFDKHNWFNKKYNNSIFRNDPTFLPINWEGKIYNLYDKTLMNNQNAQKIIEEGSSMFALKVYKELSEKQNVPIVHHITDAFAKDYLSGKEKLGNKTLALAYDESMYNTIQEGLILDKHLTEISKSYKQISRLNIRKNDGIVMYNNIIPYKEEEPYSLLSHEEIMKIDPSAQAYEIKSPFLNNIRDIIENKDKITYNAIKHAYNNQESYKKLKIPLNFLISIDRPNMTNKEKEFLITMFNKMVKDNKGRFSFSSPYLNINSTLQEVVLIRDSWIEAIVKILENI